MKGKYNLIVRDTDIVILFDFDNYTHDTIKEKIQCSTSDLARADVDGLYWKINNNEVYKAFYEFIHTDHNFEENPSCDVEKIRKEHDKMLDAVSKYLQSKGDDFTTVERQGQLERNHSL